MCVLLAVMMLSCVVITFAITVQTIYADRMQLTRTLRAVRSPGAHAAATGSSPHRRSPRLQELKSQPGRSACGWRLAVEAAVAGLCRDGPIARLRGVARSPKGRELEQRELPRRALRSGPLLAGCVVGRRVRCRGDDAGSAR